MARARLGELLVDRGLVRPSDVQNALAIQATNGEPIGLNLVRLGALSEAQLLEVLSEQLGLPVLASEDGPAPDAILSFLAEIGSPLDWWASRNAVAWREPGPDGAAASPGRILCAALQPLDLSLTERIAQATDDAVAMLLAPRALIDALLGDLTDQTAAPVDLVGGSERTRPAFANWRRKPRSSTSSTASSPRP
ncbi:MAG: hypothetical protein KJ824_00185 [Alphaproteobacteria bacterium]|nr:hypothetical protein [Alphaproteobacteria bacterium]